MKKLLILILIMVTLGSRVAIEFPILYNIIESLTWVLVVLALLKHTQNNLWLMVFAIASTDFFRDLIILIKPTEPDYKLISIVCTILVLLGSYITIPKKWSY